MSSVPVMCSLSAEVLFYVSIIVQKCIIDKVYLISWLCRVLWNCCFLMKRLFERSTFSEPLLLRTPTFFKAVIRFCKNYFSRRCCFLEQLIFDYKLVFTGTFSIYHLVINPTNTGVLRFKLLGGAQSGCTTQKIFPLNTMNKNFASNLLSQGSMAWWLRRWIPNPGVSYLKPLGSSKVYSAFHPFEVDKMSTRNFWELKW